MANNQSRLLTTIRADKLLNAVLRPIILKPIYMKYEQAIHSDLDAIKNLLEFYGLPSNDLNDHLSHFIVAKESNELVGVGGYEMCQEYALLRSFAVTESHKGLGIAEHIFKLVEKKAANAGVKSFYLLTDTAIKYFKRFKFSICSRNNAPKIIRETKQCSDLCPDTATMMCKNICI